MKQKTFTTLLLLAISLLFSSSIVKSGPTQKIDLNSATLCELDSLPGIGLSMAERILEFRRKNGPFRRVGGPDERKRNRREKISEAQRQDQSASSLLFVLLT